MARVSFKSEGTGDFEPLPDGIYKATIFEASLETSKEGKAMIKWCFKIQEEPYTERRVWSYTVLEGTTWAVEAVLSACGIEAEKNEDGNINFDIDDCIGLPVRVQLVQDEYQGKINNKVKKVLNPV